MGIRKLRKQRVADLALKFANLIKLVKCGIHGPDDLARLFATFCVAEGIGNPQDQSLRDSIVFKAMDILQSGMPQ